MLKRSMGVALVCSLFFFLFTFGGLTSAQTTITYWYSEVGEEYISAMNDIIEQFEAIYPDIKIDMVQKGTPGTFKDELLVAIIAGVPPDVVYANSFDVFEWSLTPGLVQPLNRLLPPDLITEMNQNYLNGPKTDMSRNGIWYGIPFRTDTRGLYMNVDLFETAGVDPYKGPTTIAELDALSAKLTRRAPDNTIEVLGFAPNRNNWADELPWIWAFGGEFFDYETHDLLFTEDPLNRDAVEWIQSYAQRYGADAQSSQAEFLAGHVAMHVNSTTRLVYFPDQNPDLNWWTSYVPSVEGVPQTSLGASLGPMIPAGAEHPEAAAKFLAFFAKPEVQIEWYSKTKSLPTRYEAMTGIIPLVDDPRERTMIEILPVTRVVPPLYSQLRVAWRGNLDRMRRQEITPQAVLENTQREMEALYREAFSQQ